MRDTETGVLYCNDNVQRLRAVPNESVDLIYLDPPFFSAREDGVEHYVAWTWERGHELHRVLRETGALYLHCDRHASHDLKNILDEVFGTSNFRSELTWRRTHTRSDGHQLGGTHDTIVFYARSSYTPYAPSRISRSEKDPERFSRCGLYWMTFQGRLSTMPRTDWTSWAVSDGQRTTGSPVLRLARRSSQLVTFAE